MAVTLEWIRDNYDADKDRRIVKAEAITALKDLYAGRITVDEYTAVEAVYNNNTLLPAYSDTPVSYVYPTHCAMLLACDTNNDGIIDMAESFAATERTDLSVEEKAIVGEAYIAGSINAYSAGCYTPPVAAPQPVAEGSLFNISCPPTATNGESIDIYAAVKNIGDTSGEFRIALYEITTVNYTQSVTLIHKSPIKLISVGSTGGLIAFQHTTPSSGTSVSYRLDCIRVDPTEIVDATHTVGVVLSPAIPCIAPIVTYVRFPEIWFEGTTAFCEVKIDVGEGNKIDIGNSIIELYDGVGWASPAATMGQLDPNASSQTVTLKWTMKAHTTKVLCSCWIRSSCGKTSPYAANSDYYTYPVVTPPTPCPNPTASFSTPKIWFEGSKAFCKLSLDAGEGQTVDISNSAFTGYNGASGVSLNRLLTNERSQTVTASWDMVQATTRCYANILIRNACGSFASVNTGYFTYPPVTAPPTPPAGSGDPSSNVDTQMLAAGTYDIEIYKTGYDTVHANITVSSSGVVSCNSVTGGACGGSGYPRVEAALSSVKVYMAVGATTSPGFDAWVTSKGGRSSISLPDIFELKDEFIGLTVSLGFVPTLEQIMECKDAFIGL